MADVDPEASLRSLVSHEAALTGQERLEAGVAGLVLAQLQVTVGAAEAASPALALHAASLLARVRCNAHQVDTRSPGTGRWISRYCRYYRYRQAPVCRYLDIVDIIDFYTGSGV